MSGIQYIGIRQGFWVNHENRRLESSEMTAASPRGTQFLNVCKNRRSTHPVHADQESRIGVTNRCTEARDRGVLRMAHQLRNLAMQNKLILNSVLCILLPISAVAQEEVESPSLKTLHQAIAKLVVRHYPKATSHVFEKAIGFEYSTRVFVTRIVSKIPGSESPLAAERGPMNDGVWCDVWYRTGDLDTEPAYARSEGVTKREFFKEHIYYPNDSRKRCHLLVTLRLPLETTNEQRLFVKELRVLLSQFGKYLPEKDDSISGDASG